MRRIARKFTLNEISAVRKPAQAHATVVIMKSAEDQDAKALILKRLGEVRYEFDAGEVMSKMLEEGLFDGFEKQEIEDMIVLRADEIKKPRESAASAYARAIVEDGVAKVLFKAARRVTGILPTTAAIKRAEAEIAKTRSGAAKPGHDTPEGEERRSVAELEAANLGPANAKFHSMAIDHQRAHSKMSYQGAYSHIYTQPENAALREAAKQEYLARALRG
jgi:hypothetical protein